MEVFMYRSNTIPNYTFKEELINSVSHGVGAVMSVFALVFMIFKSNSFLELVLVSIFGSTLISLYSISCVYHALAPSINGKKVLRVLDHSNVYLLVFGTYLPISILGICGVKSIVLVCFVGVFSLTGIVLTCIDIDRFQVMSVVCHLLNGWSALLGIHDLFSNVGFYGVLFLVLGGVMYSIGSILYGLGSHVRYMHSIFHFFCILGSLCHFICVYFFLL